MKTSKRILHICAKCSNMFSADLLEEGVRKTYTGYVPDFFPEQHWGDYVELKIDADTGQILNWKVPTKKDLKDFA